MCNVKNKQGITLIKGITPDISLFLMFYPLLIHLDHQTMVGHSVKIDFHIYNHLIIIDLGGRFWWGLHWYILSSDECNFFLR